MWNATADRHPAVITRCTSANDVATALDFARRQNLPIAVRGGAHSYPGYSTCDDGMVIDLSRMSEVTVDPEAKTARAGGGALLGDLDRATQAQGLACPSGAVAHTGVAGLTLGGGLGRLMRLHGLTIDNLLSVDLITADGRSVRASEEENPELFWGVRGAGPNFGVATSFEFRLHPIGPEIYSGSALFPRERAHEVADFFDDYARNASDDLTATLSFSIAPTEGPFPQELAGGPYVSIGTSHCGSSEEANRAFESIRSLSPAAETFGPTTYLGAQSLADEFYAWGKRNYWKGVLLKSLAPRAIDVFLEQLYSAPVNHAAFALMTMGGAMGRVPEDATAFSGRDASLWMLVDLQWLDPAADEANFAWGRSSMDALRPFATAVNYVNDLGNVGTDGVRAAYGDDKYDRLVALKRAWDPDNIFKLNQNIAP